MDADFVVCNEPLEMCAKKPFDHAHEVDSCVLFEKALKFGFNVVGRELDKVINLEAKRDDGVSLGSAGLTILPENRQEL